MGKATWKESQIDLTDESLKIQGHPVMEAWEHPYMKSLAKIATSKGGCVLELGFGMSISANYIHNYVCRRRRRALATSTGSGQSRSMRHERSIGSPSGSWKFPVTKNERTPSAK